MTDDLLSSVRRELETRLGELRPLVAEYERLFAAAAVLDTGEEAPVAEEPTASAPNRRARRARRVAGATTEEPAKPAPRPRASARGKQRAYAPRGAAQNAILAALEHGSHTTSELVSVTALPAASIRANLQRLLKGRVITRTTRGGRSAYTLVSRSSAT
jgi:hypothetical protein